MPPDDEASHAPEPTRQGLAAGGFQLFARPGPGRRPAWLLFDDIWYAARYQVVEPRAFYRAFGARLRRSPNRCFDESWYVARHADVRADIASGLYASGFEHYCAGGFADRSPHWLFDEAWYRQSNPDVFARGGALEQRGYANGYDHYLTEGANQGRQPSRYFDEAVWRIYRLVCNAAEAARTPLEQALMELETASDAARFIRTSWYFDPAWYLHRYPEVPAAIAAGQWSSPLAHYLGNPTPTLFDPNAHFSEAGYARAYPDVASAVQAGSYRNGYDHFLENGAREKRRPSPEIDLAQLADARVQMEIAGGLYPDAFAYYVASQIDPVPRSIQDRMAPTELQAKLQFTRAAALAASVLVRHPLDFSRPGDVAPVVSVIMVLHNQFALTLSALASLRAQPCAVDLILVDSGSSDETRGIERQIRGARVLRFASNIGFIAGCNAALAEAQAPAVLFLNNDVTLGPNAVAIALARLASRPDAGAVGGRIVRSHGRLQEAGCILWRGGHATGYLRDGAPDLAEANFVREVDFCSAAFLLVHTPLARALGGFDPVFSPAYYEDTDFCVRLRQRGHVVLYDPDVLVQHYEYGSSSEMRASGQMERSRGVFFQRHAEFLRFQYNYRGTEYVRARSSRRGGRRILVIEDRIPLRRLGSGYVRSNDIVRAMDALGYEVTVFPVQPEPDAQAALRCDFPDTVEIMHDRSAASFAAFVRERSGMYDLVWIGRTHNLQQLLPQLALASGDIPDFGIILDTEAVVAPRAAARRELAGLVPAAGEPPLQQALEHELACGRFCQAIIAVNQLDAGYIRQCGHEAVDVLGHLAEPRPTQLPFDARSGLLFVGAIHAEDSPNFDGLAWFVDAILPLLGRTLGDVHLTIAGHVAAGVRMNLFARDRRIELLGETDDLAGLYDRHRVFVAPTRYAGGIPFKVHEAASFGLPVVATSLLCAQLAWRDREEILDGGPLDAAVFARQLHPICIDRRSALATYPRQGAGDAGDGEQRDRISHPAGPHPKQHAGAERRRPVAETGKDHWCCRGELNPGPRPYQGRALPLSYDSAPVAPFLAAAHPERKPG